MKYKNIIGKLSFYLGSFLSGGLCFYIIYRLWEKYDTVKDTSKFLKSIFNYKIQESNNLTIGKILILLAVFFIGIKLSKIVSYKIVEKFLNKTKLNKGAKAAIENLTYYILISITSLMSLHIADVPLTVFTLFGGALAIGLGFGSQNILSNFISGIILQVEQPVKVGDIIEIEGVTGTIESIGGRSTKIIASNNTHMIIPNSYLLDKKLVNWTYQDNILRSKIEIIIDYKTNHDEFKSAVMDILDSFEHIMKYPEPRVQLVDYQNFGLQYAIYFWVPIQGTMDKNQIESEFRVLLLEKLREKQINIPFPTHHIKMISKDIE